MQKKEKSIQFRIHTRGFRGTIDEKIRQLVSTRLTSSRDRFSSQFIGKSLMKNHGLVYSGACFEMGLLATRGERKNLEVTLTPNGLDFTKLKNPVIAFVDGEKQTHKDTFTNEECDFIQKEIIGRYELEGNIIENILKIRKTLQTNKDGKYDIVKNIWKIFREEKKHYLLEKFPDIKAKKTAYSISDDEIIQWRIEKIMDEKGTYSGKPRDSLRKQLISEIDKKDISNNDVLEYLTDKHIQYQINATMSRINELFPSDFNTRTY